MCDDAQEAKCLAETGDDLIEWTCSKCEKIRPRDLGEYTQKIFRQRLLRLAGYPFRANDMTPEEWEDLGRAEEMLKGRDEEKRLLLMKSMMPPGR